MDGCQVLKLLSLQVREGQAQIFGVCPQSEISQFAAEILSQPLAQVSGYFKSLSLSSPVALILTWYRRKETIERQCLSAW